MRLIEWEVSEDGYEEQIVIPKKKGILSPKKGLVQKTSKRLLYKS